MRAKILLFVILILLVFNSMAIADWEPNILNFISASSPGGETDRRARPIANIVGEIMGARAVMYDNRAGGGGVVGTLFLKNNMPDDGTSILVSYQLRHTTGELRGAPYKSLEDFAPIIAYSESTTGLHVKTDSPFETFMEFIEYARENPNRLTIGHIAAGSCQIQVLELMDLFDIKLRLVPYDGGGPGRAALIGGHIDLFSGVSETPWTAMGDDVRTLATYTPGPHPLRTDLPSVQCIVENYFPDLEVPRTLTQLGIQHFFITHGNVPEERLRKLHAAFKEALQSEEVLRVAEAGMWVPQLTSFEETQELFEYFDTVARNYRHIFIDD